MCAYIISLRYLMMETSHMDEKFKKNADEFIKKEKESLDDLRFEETAFGDTKS